jgi:hypothetical protein
MKNKKFNKKGQIDSTLTWFVAIFIIMFILMVFLVIIFLMADKKSLTGMNDVKNNGVDLTNDPGVSEGMFAILNSKILYNGKTILVLDAVINSSLEFIEASKIYGIDSVEVKQLHEKQNELALSIVGLRSFCNDSSLLAPFGLINSDYFLIGKEGKTNDYLVQDIDESKYTPIVSYNINYNGTEIKIKYKQPLNCSLVVDNVIK